MPESCFGPICGWVHLLSPWLKLHILPVAPLMTAAIAAIAGIVAIISILVTKQIARRRATIDFFLKTEADKSIVEIFQRFDESLEVVNQHIDSGTALREITKTREYKDVHTCLNIHELLAIGISTSVFDKKVAYHYWSAALVSHRQQADKLINYSREDPSDYSAYIGMIELAEQWEKEISNWVSKHPPAHRALKMAPGPAAAPNLTVRPPGSLPNGGE